MNLKKKEILSHKNEEKKQIIHNLKSKRNELINQNENSFTKVLRKQIEEQLKKGINGTLDSADKLAENNAIVKYALHELK